jgi:hypothetical protein
MKYFTDLAHDMEWEYMIVDWLWYGEVFIQKEGVQLPNPEADITTPIKEVDMEGCFLHLKTIPLFHFKSIPL